MTIRKDHPSDSKDGTNKEPTIGLGAAARRELASLMRVIHETPTRELLQDALSFKTEMHGLHLACGSGEDTFLIASLLNEKSTIHGIDADPVLIEAARRKRPSKKEDCIQFTLAGPEFWQPGKHYDFIYTRYCAFSPADRNVSLPNLYRQLAPDGILIAEVMSYSGFTAYPYNHAFSRTTNLISSMEVPMVNGQQSWSDLFLQAGFDTVGSTYVAPAFLPRQHHHILSLSLEFFRETLQHNQLADREELNALLLELQQYEQQEDTLIGRAGVLQLVSRKKNLSK